MTGNRDQERVREWPSTHVTLLNRLKDPQDEQSWELFWSVYAPLMHRYCLRRGVQDADAQDVCQNVMLVLRKSLITFEYDAAQGRFRNWLGTIVLREIIRHAHRQQQAGRAVGGDFEPGIDQPQNDATWIAEFNSYIFQVAIERIRPEIDDLEWSIFEELWLKDRKPQEVSLEVGKPLDWLYRAKYRVVKRLKTEVVYLAADIPALNKD